MFPSCLLNKSLKIKKEEKKSSIAFGKGPVCQLRYCHCQQHMIPTKCARFISRHFLDMMHDRLNCQTVATLLIIAHKRLLFDKFREVSSFYRNSMFFKKNAWNSFGSFQCVRESVNELDRSVFMDILQLKWRLCKIFISERVALGVKGYHRRLNLPELNVLIHIKKIRKFENCATDAS